MIFQKNLIYLHTNYFQIYDRSSKRLLHCRIEILEGLLMDVYLINYVFMGNSVKFYSILAFIFSNICLTFYFFAFLYFFFVDPPQNTSPNSHDFYGMKIKDNHHIPFELIEGSRVVKSNPISREKPLKFIPEDRYIPEEKDNMSSANRFLNN